MNVCTLGRTDYLGKLGGGFYPQITPITLIVFCAFRSGESARSVDGKDALAAGAGCSIGPHADARGTGTQTVTQTGTPGCLVEAGVEELVDHVLQALVDGVHLGWDFSISWAIWGAGGFDVFDDLIHVARCDWCEPGLVGIDDHVRPVVTGSEAHVGADFEGLCGGQLGLEPGEYLVALAYPAIHVLADEDESFIHGASSKRSSTPARSAAVVYQSAGDRQLGGPDQ